MTTSTKTTYNLSHHGIEIMNYYGAATVVDEIATDPMSPIADRTVLYTRPVPGVNRAYS
jgi:uncharacterized protein (UPF0147 family)